MTNYRSRSRKDTPWTEDEYASATERFIDECNHDNYYRKHPSVKDSKEKDLLNSIDPRKCPKCGDAHVIRYGKTGIGMKRYRCCKCGKTIFDQRKIPITEWLDFLLTLFGYGSFSLTSKGNRNAYNTTRYWMDKVFLLLKSWQTGIVLEGSVWLDETYYPVRKGDVVTDVNGHQPRGLSRNKICISVACDKDNVVCIAEGFGKPSLKRTLGAMGSHIRKGSLLIHDGDNSHRSLIEELELESEVHTCSETKWLEDKDNPLDPVNRNHKFLKRFLNTHSGFLRDDIQDYLNLFSFISSKPTDKFEKVKILLELALHDPILLRYRK